MAGYKEYSSREFQKILKKNGYKHVSTHGSHMKYKRDSDTVVITKRMHILVAQRLIKEHKLKI